MKTESDTDVEICGRIQVKENRYPVPDLVVNIYKIDTSVLDGKRQNWFDCVCKKEKESFILGNDVTDESGSFRIKLTLSKIGEQNEIAIAVYPSDGNFPIYLSPIPMLPTNRPIIIRIPKKALDEIDQLPPDPPSITTILNRSEKEREEVSAWLSKTRNEQHTQNQIDVDKVFKNFRPSNFSPSILKSPNYIRSTKRHITHSKLKETELEEKQQWVREKLLEKINESPSITRKIRLPNDIEFGKTIPYKEYKAREWSMQTQRSMGYKMPLVLYKTGRPRKRRLRTYFTHLAKNDSMI